MAEIMLIIWQLNALNNWRFRRDAESLAAWKSAKRGMAHVGLRRRREAGSVSGKDGKDGNCRRSRVTPLAGRGCHATSRLLTHSPDSPLPSRTLGCGSGRYFEAGEINQASRYSEGISP